MKIVGADAYWDGGTVCVDIEEKTTVTRFELDHSLPWDGRPRHISISANGETRKIPIGSEEERGVCFKIRGCLEKEYGADAVCDALETSHARKVAWDDHCAKQESLLVSPTGYNDPHPLPFDGFWLLVFDFVEKAYFEGKL
jgi:hypothetical protein